MCVPFGMYADTHPIHDVLLTCLCICRTQILSHLGTCVKDFPSVEDAFALVAASVAENAEEFGHEGTEIPNKNPYLHKYYYVRDHGQTKSWKKNETKELEGSCDLKSKKQLLDSGLFAEALGAPPREGTAEDTSTVKVENVVYAELKKVAAPLRSKKHSHSPKQEHSGQEEFALLKRSIVLNKKTTNARYMSTNVKYMYSHLGYISDSYECICRIQMHAFVHAMSARTWEQYAHTAPT